VPPNGHHADARVTLRDDGGYELAIGTAEFGNGTTIVHAQIAATALGTTAACIRIRQSDTNHIGHDTGAFGSTGTVVAGLATRRAAWPRLRGHPQGPGLDWPEHGGMLIG
jgi:CO/xanthine dehydrogenase Mo-binding subunit